MAERDCRWHCGQTTKNISRICDACWTDREAIRQARKAGEAAKEPSAARRAGWAKAKATRMGKFEVQKPVTELLE